MRKGKDEEDCYQTMFSCPLSAARISPVFPCLGIRVTRPILACHRLASQWIGLGQFEFAENWVSKLGWNVLELELVDSKLGPVKCVPTSVLWLFRCI